MEKLMEDLEDLRKAEVRPLIEGRIKEFKKTGRGSVEVIFKELCFCILTANFSAERGIKMQQQIDDGFLTLSEPQLTERLQKLGHRFPEARAKYIVEARRWVDSLRSILKSFQVETELRQWLAENVKGLGYKESSHFLRNIGYEDLAILDFHILDLLVKYKLIERPRTLTKKQYLEIEELLRRIARRLDMSLAEMDLYLWYMETGKVLK